MSVFITSKNTRNGAVHVIQEGVLFRVTGGGREDTRHPTWDYACDELWRRIMAPKIVVAKDTRNGRVTLSELQRGEGLTPPWAGWYA